MSDQHSNTFSSTEEEIKCPNCGSNIIRPDKSGLRKNEIYTIYDFNKDHFTCRACGKVIVDQGISNRLKSLLNLI